MSYNEILYTIERLELELIQTKCPHTSESIKNKIKKLESKIPSIKSSS